MNVGSLFTGIGGFDLGLERAGMSVVWQCESDDFCRRVLAHHWPDVPCYEDVRNLSSAAGTPQVDIICGGFPCQDISGAGKRAGIDGTHSGLWSEYARIVGELRPRYVVVENVADLLVRGLGRVLGDLAEIGYDAEWDCIPASAAGAPHQRDRIWLVAYPAGTGLERSSGETSLGERRSSLEPSGCVEMADSQGQRRSSLRSTDPQGRADVGAIHAGWWTTEPDVGRVADGVPQRVDRLRALGNALVPQIAQWIGERIMSWENADA